MSVYQRCPRHKAKVKGSRRQARCKCADAVWRVQISLGLAANGKYDRQYVGAYRTRAEAEAAERRAITNREHGIDVRPTTLTVADLLRRYIEYREHLCGREARTIAGYNEKARHYIIPHIGGLPVAKLRPSNISAWMTSLLECGGAKASPLSPASARHALVLLRGACRWAVRMQLLAHDPTAAIERPRVAKSRTGAIPKDERTRLLRVANATRWGPLVTLALLTGARRGELAALRWTDIDLDGFQPYLTIRTALTEIGPRVIEKSPKTDRERRIGLGPAALDALRRQRALQAAERLRAGPLYVDEGRVFAQEDGRTLAPTRITGAFGRLARQAQISTTSFHRLRHTAATTMIAAGADIRSVSAILGHANPSTTLSIYTHAVTDAQNRALATLETDMAEASSS